MIVVRITATHAHGEIEIEERMDMVPHDTEGYQRAVEATAVRCVARVKQALDPEGREK